jgi:hypothetical protein
MSNKTADELIIELATMKEQLEELQNTKTTEYEYIEFARMSKEKFEEMDEEIRNRGREIEYLKENNISEEREKELTDIINDMEIEITEEEKKVAEFTSKWRKEQNNRMYWKKQYNKLKCRCYYTDLTDSVEMNNIKHMCADDWNDERNKMLERFMEIKELNKIMKKQRKEKVILDNYLYIQKEYTIEDIGTTNYYYKREELKKFVEKYTDFKSVKKQNKKDLVKVLQHEFFIPNIMKIQRRFRYRKTLPMRFIFDITTLRMKLEKWFAETTVNQRNCLKSIMIKDEVVEENGNRRNLNLEPYTDDDDGKRFSMIWTIVLSKHNNRYYAGSILKKHEQITLAQGKYSVKDFNELKDRFKDINFLDTHTGMGINRYAFSDAVVKSFVVAESLV